jgi:chemotaxis protein MotA
MDMATVAGITIALGAIFGGFTLEGGHIGAILQPTAGIIVVGGTIGAVCVQFPGKGLKRAMKDFKLIFSPPKEDLDALVQQMLAFASKARKDGVVSLEEETEKITEPFFKKALSLAVDGSEPSVIRDTMEIDQSHMEEEGEVSAKVFEAAGGYSPTVGILGAVLGLIHVMQNLSDPSKLGAGIAVAFVATVYGVAIANLLCLPAAGKLKERHKQSMMKYDMILTGIVSIVEGENPRLLEQKMTSFLGHDSAHASKGTGSTASSENKAA